MRAIMLVIVLVVASYMIYNIAAPWATSIPLRP